MHRREFDSMLLVPIKPLASLLTRYCASIDICPATQTRGRAADRLRHRQRRRILVARAAHERVFQATRLAQRDVRGLPFGAEPSEIRRMFLVAGNLHDLAVLDV